MKFIGKPEAAGDIEGVTAGTGLSGGGASGAVTLNLDISSLSEVAPANGDTILTLDSDGATEQRSSVADLATLYAGTGLTASNSVISVDAAQSGITSLGTLTGLIIDGDKDVTPGDGAMLHIDTSTIRDTATLESGTASLYTHAKIEGPTLTAQNASVTTTDAATLYVTRPAAGTNQTVSNLWGIYTNGATRTLGLTNGSNYSQTAGDMTLYDATNNGNPTFSIGSSATERLEIKAEYESGAQGLDVVKFVTHTAGSGSDDGRYAFQVDETFIFNILDAGVRIKASGNLEIGSGNAILSDSSGTTTLSNIDALDATTESTIESAIDTLGNLTSASSLATVGTISSGTWQGTAIATDQQKHLAWFTLKGYGTGDGTNYEIPEIISDTNAPFEHNTSTGSDGLTAQTVQTMMRLGGLVVPRAGTLKKWYGWATTAGSQAANIGLFRVRPTRNDNSNLTPVLLDNVSYTALGNTKMEDFDETSFTDADIAIGDIIYTGIKCQDSKTTYFTSTLEIEWD